MGSQNGRCRPGGAVRIVADYGRASHAWDGYVDRVEAQLDEQTRTLDLIVRVPDPFSGGVRVADDIVVGSGADAGDVAGGFRGPHLLVGKFVEVKIQRPIPDEYFRVRRAALRLGDEVWAVRGGTPLTIVPERVLQRSDDELYVTGALASGQPLVVDGVQVATEGMAVRVTTGGEW